jgi:spore maturation protein CgeB
VRPLRPPSIRESQIGATLFDAEYIRVTREAMVAIGVNRVPSANRSPHRPLVYSRLRDIEAPMLGACYLTEWTEGLEHMYELGKEIETYRTAEELTSKLSELRRDPVRRRAMRKQAQRRALSDHNVARSIARIGAHFGFGDAHEIRAVV